MTCRLRSWWDTDGSEVGVVQRLITDLLLDREYLYCHIAFECFASERSTPFAVHMPMPPNLPFLVKAYLSASGKTSSEVIRCMELFESSIVNSKHGVEE